MHFISEDQEGYSIRQQKSGTCFLADRIFLAFFPEKLDFVEETVFLGTFLAESPFLIFAYKVPAILCM